MNLYTSPMLHIRTLKVWSRRCKISRVRARLIEKLVDEIGFSMVEAGGQLGVSPLAVAKPLGRRDIDES